jgi:signal transduction histidine kinase
MWKTVDLDLDFAIVSPNMSELLQVIIAWAVELLGADAGEIFLWDEANGHLIQSIGFGRMERYIGLILKPGEGIVGKVFESGQPMIVPDYSKWPGRLEVYVQESPTTDMTVPMIWQDRTIGVLGITADPLRRTFSEEDVRPATLFANLAALAIHNHRMCDALQDRADRLKAILDREVAERTAQMAHWALQLETSARVSRQITSILDTKALVSSVVELISQSFDYPYVHIYLCDERTDTLALRASTVVQVSERLHELKIGEGSLNGAAALMNEPVLVKDVSLHPNYVSGLVTLPDVRSELVIPLRMGCRVLGTLDVQSRRLADFSEEDVRLIQSLGDQIAIAVENAHLYDQSRRLAALEERSYLARELHDSVTQLLFSITLNAETARMLLKRDGPQVEDETALPAILKRLQALSHQAMNEMRTLVHQLRPGAEAEHGLLDQVRELIKEREKCDALHVALQIEGERSLPARYELALFRIIQEALNNVVKHAHVSSAVVTLRLMEDSVLLTVEDQGVGFDCQSRFSGVSYPARPGQSMPTLGLTSMRERAELLGGDFEIESKPGSGTRIRVLVPDIHEG